MQHLDELRTGDTTACGSFEHDEAQLIAFARSYDPQAFHLEHEAARHSIFGTLTGSGLALTLAGAGNGSLASIIGTGAGTLSKTGAGMWTLSAANTYTGATSITGGTLQITNAAGLGTAASGTTVTSAALRISGSFNLLEPLTLSTGTVITDGGDRLAVFP